MKDETKYAKALAYIAYQLSKHFEDPASGWSNSDEKCVFVNGPRYGLLICSKDISPHDALKTSPMRSSNSACNFFKLMRTHVRKDMKESGFKPNLLEELIMTPVELLNVMVDVDLQLSEQIEKFLI